jgi:hypothetical protein
VGQTVERAINSCLLRVPFWVSRKQHFIHRQGILTLVPSLCVSSSHRRIDMTQALLHAGLGSSRIDKGLTVEMT